MSVRTGKAPRGKEPAEETPKGSKPGQAADKPKTESSTTGSPWGKLPSGPPPRTPPRTPTHMSSSSTNGLSAKAKANSKTSAINIAALAARNLGGFVPNKIFVGGVPIQSTEEQFKAYFERFGAISKVELHALRGFGYITYESVESVDDCLTKYEEHYLCKKWVDVKRSIPRELIDSYEREQKRLEAEFKAQHDAEHGIIDEAPSVKVETPSHSVSSPTAWAMPPPSRGPVLPAPAVRSRGTHPPTEEPRGSAMTSQISQLTDMGFSEEKARRVFRECAWDFNKALDTLLSSMGDEEPEEPAAVSAPLVAEDPPLSAALTPTPKSTGPGPAPENSPKAQPKESPPSAWGKPPPTSSWAKPPETVWGMPKPAATGAWGKAPPASVAKAQPGTPKAAATPKSSPTTPKATAIGAPKAAGYNSASGEAAASPPVATTSTPATPPKATAASAPPQSPLPPAALPPAADAASALESNSAEPQPRSPPSESATAPPTSQPPAQVTEGKGSGDALVSSKPGSTEAVQDSIAVAAATNLLAGSDGGSQPAPVSAAEPPVARIPAAGESTAGHVDAANAPDGAPAGTPPRKRTQRMKREWTAEDPSQLSAAEGDFVNVWIDTGTEHGWIHSELIGGIGGAGWLPVCVLQVLPDNRRWMKTKQAWQAMGESQCNVADGTQVVVWVDSRTEQGWTYIEASEDTQPGWLPDFCLEWNDT